MTLTADLNHLLPPGDDFTRRHIGPDADAIAKMLAVVGHTSLDGFIDAVVPAALRTARPLAIAPATEDEALAELETIAARNQIFRSFIGMGYYDCLTPSVIRRNILENPGWYTQYTPYQAEIAQGRLEAMLNFQTMIADLTGLPCANASLLDEGTAAAEAMHMAWSLGEDHPHRFFVADDCHPQTIAVVQARAEPLGIEVVVGDVDSFDFAATPVFGALVQYPATDGKIRDYTDFCARAHDHKSLVIVAADLLALVLLKAPGELGADIAVGSAQRFGVPMGFGGPHAAYMSTRDAYKRQMPGRLVGVSIDAEGRPAMRLALQTREQHIRREKATSNICTAQVLLAVMASMYAVYHGPKGLTRIASRVRAMTLKLREGLLAQGWSVGPDSAVFDTLTVAVGDQHGAILDAARSRRINLRSYSDGRVGVSLDEATTVAELEALLGLFAQGKPTPALTGALDALPENLARTSDILTHPIFNRYHSETEMQRYMRKLESRDLSLTAAMIPLGSCTMKLNAATEMLPVTWAAFGRMHPFAPAEQASGYHGLFDQLSGYLSEITGLPGVSLQPNAGSQGEYTGLLVIRRYHTDRGEGHRKVCLIPASAHGTNPASAALAGMQVVVVKCDSGGNVDLNDLRARAAQYQDQLSALMITYPSTHGVFEETIREICSIIHNHGGQVYMDGANLNALVGLVRPGELGVDVLHINLHKTFCIPHGGGGPGMGPICVGSHLAPHLPGHPVVSCGGDQPILPVSAAPWGSASILVIPWTYIRMMGGAGLTHATKVAILAANYISRRLADAFPTLYTGHSGYVAHECILELRHLKASTGVEVEDVAKRLMDYGFHAPTVSFPVAGTLMVEPTESEPLAEIDRLCDALIAIRAEMDQIAAGTYSRTDNPLKNAPHTARAVTAPEWNRAYSRTIAAFPTPAQREFKFWPAVARVNNVHGDRNLICTCPPIEEYEAAK